MANTEAVDCKMGYVNYIQVQNMHKSMMKLDIFLGSTVQFKTYKISFVLNFIIKKQDIDYIF